MRKPELLIPASSLEVLKTAVIFGADAVYIGGEVFGLRAKAKNFSMEEMKEGIEELKQSSIDIDIEEIFKSIDTEHSGKIDYTEFLAASMDK